MKKTHALLIGNGQTLPAVFLKELAAKADLIVAADGGADRALQAGLTPQIIIGDLDSISAQAKKCVSSENLVFVQNQNNTDLEKSLDWILSHKITSCTLAGFMGGRWDFTFGNLLSVLPYIQRINLFFAGPGWELYPIQKSKRFGCMKGKRVSLIPVRNCMGVCLKGLKYPLQNASLKAGTGRTISNETTGKSFCVELKKGCLFVYKEN